MFGAVSRVGSGLLAAKSVAVFQNVAKSSLSERGTTLKETIKGFSSILEGEYDHLPEIAFYMVGPIEEVVAKADTLAKNV